MKNRMSNASQEFVEFFSRVACWIWETIEKLFDIILDFLARIIELILAVMNLIFQVICFLRDLCIEAMQTFANVFRGIVNVVSNISCEEVEDFVSACIVVLLWIVAFKLVRNLLQNSRIAAFLKPRHTSLNINDNNKVERLGLGVCPAQRRTGKRINRRNSKRPRIDPKQEFND
ncbi:uncharacterized protein LOC126923923 [Bombus affinis]|uniref:Uncharacterized protein LOC105666570 n=1 Tax=Bombus terrestris TaxID=30195 RepID=A0A9C6SG10_BOMTE|nr:uncharacterized protein LOC105666570 [Bombus terrestris]XP_050593837.1 uncharacterized protein LOC126923923 [Bombus affinis]